MYINYEKVKLINYNMHDIIAIVINYNRNIFNLNYTPK